MRSRISIRGCVRWLVGKLVGQYVSRSLCPVFFTWKKKQKMNKKLNRSMKNEWGCIPWLSKPLVIMLFMPCFMLSGHMSWRVKSISLPLYGNGQYKRDTLHFLGKSFAIVNLLHMLFLETKWKLNQNWNRHRAYQLIQINFCNSLHTPFVGF